MWGFNGVGLNRSLDRFYDPSFLVLLAAAVVIVTFLPNTQQIMRNYRPAVNWRLWTEVGRAPLRWNWRPATLGLLFVSAAIFMGVEFIQRGAETFVYFNF
jgi:alginate O-acetyltransferase complex protein AlgI